MKTTTNDDGYDDSMCPCPCRSVGLLKNTENIADIYNIFDEKLGQPRQVSMWHAKLSFHTLWFSDWVSK